MAGREAPARAHLPKQPVGEHGTRSPQAPAQAARCLGAAAQLAAVHRTLRNGPALQLQAGGTAAGGQPAAAPRVAAANRTGLPDRLKAGVEALSGISLDGVRVHYNSPKPAQLNAHAYAQGSDIHLAPGQEAHLPHEAWHVVQQQDGRVRPTLQMKGVSINDDARLEHEADAFGQKAMSFSVDAVSEFASRDISRLTNVSREGVVQAVWLQHDKNIWRWDILVTGVMWFTDGNLYWYEIDGKEGAQFKEYAGIEKARTHSQWKDLGAGDLPEADLLYEAMHSLMPTGKDDKTALKWGGMTVRLKGGKFHKPAERTQFYQWLFNDKPPGEMNCYEVVLYAAVKANLRPKQWVIQQMELREKTVDQGPAFVSSFTEELKWDGEGNIITTIPRGHVLIFGPNGEHVALATGTTEKGEPMALELDRKGNVELSSIKAIANKYPQYVKVGGVRYGPLP